MSRTIGVDVGGTKIAGALVDQAGGVQHRARRDSPASDPDAIAAVIADLVGELRGNTGELRGNNGDEKVEAVGVAAAGFIDRDRSTVLFSPNLAWREEPLRRRLEEQLDLPVVIENDANAAAWGEFRFGAGGDVEDLLLVTLGTGVGGGIVLEGRLHRGAFGVAAEIGHIRVVPQGRLCGCGNLGCWEQYASGTALERVARERALLDQEHAEGLVARAGGHVCDIDGRLVTRAARDGDAFAVEQLRDLGHWVGEGLATLAAVLDPAVAAVGGGVVAAGDLLLEPAREAFAAHLTGARHRPRMTIRPAELGNTAGMLGAADLARRG